MSHNHIPLHEEQSAALDEVRAQLDPIDTPHKIEHFRRAKNKIVSRFDRRRDLYFPGWRDQFSMQIAG